MSIAFACSRPSSSRSAAAFLRELKERADSFVIRQREAYKHSRCSRRFAALERCRCLGGMRRIQRHTVRCMLPRHVQFAQFRVARRAAVWTASWVNLRWEAPKASATMRRRWLAAVGALEEHRVVEALMRLRAGAVLARRHRRAAIGRRGGTRCARAPLLAGECCGVAGGELRGVSPAPNVSASRSHRLERARAAGFLREQVHLDQLLEDVRIAKVPDATFAQNIATGIPAWISATTESRRCGRWCCRSRRWRSSHCPKLPLETEQPAAAGEARSEYPRRLHASLCPCRRRANARGGGAERWRRDGKGRPGGERLL